MHAMVLKTYLENLDLKPSQPYVSKRITLGVAAPELPRLGENEQAFFSERSILSFASGVSEQSRKDILNTTLLAQMAANSRSNDQADITNWYYAFIDVLMKTGWVIEGGDMQTFKSKSNLFEAESVVIDILTSAFGAGYITVIKKTLEAIKHLASADRKIKAFEQNTSKVSKGCFQIALVTEEHGVMAMKIGTFILSSERQITTILFFTSTSEETSLDYISKKATLNTDFYQVIRQKVTEKLGNFLFTNIAEIKLA